MIVLKRSLIRPMKRLDSVQELEWIWSICPASWAGDRIMPWPSLPVKPQTILFFPLLFTFVLIHSRILAARGKPRAFPLDSPASRINFYTSFTVFTYSASWQTSAGNGLITEEIYCQQRSALAHIIHQVPASSAACWSLQLQALCYHSSEL